MREADALQKDYSRYRYERAEEELVVAKEMFESKHYRAANNRAYYAIFHALRAVLVLDAYDSKKHSGIISEFRRRYIKNGIFENDISIIIGDAFDIRTASDYDDMFIAVREDTANQIEGAERVIQAIGKYLRENEIM